MRGELHAGAEALELLRGPWDALAVAASRPYGAPAWQLGWWRRAARPDGEPLALVARDGAHIAGLFALYATRTPTGLERLRVLGAAMAQGTGPVALPGREPEVARAFAEALALRRGPRPATLELQGVLDGERWAALMRDGWPGRARPLLLHDRRVVAPLVTLAAGIDTLDGWLAGRSANFRQQVRRARRKLESAGARFHRAESPAEIAAVLPALLALHERRFEERGGSAAVDARTEAVLAEVARQAGGGGRAHVEAIDLDGQTISAHLFLTAGEEMTYWLGGFDDEHAAGKPGLVALVAGVGTALERGVRRLDLGPGEHPYKYRMADAERHLDWLRLLPPGPRLPLTLAQLAPRWAAREAVRRVPPERIESVRARFRRG
ncbi:MAG TPA: GNAT family N-acetyltransferase [Solirubrobacteraceae bacterium]